MSTSDYTSDSAVHYPDAWIAAQPNVSSRWTPPSSANATGIVLPVGPSRPTGMVAQPNSTTRAPETVSPSGTKLDTRLAFSGTFAGHSAANTGEAEQVRFGHLQAQIEQLVILSSSHGARLEGLSREVAAITRTLARDGDDVRSLDQALEHPIGSSHDFQDLIATHGSSAAASDMTGDLWVEALDQLADERTLDPDFIVPLTSALSSSDDAVRAAAGRALATLGSAEAVAAIAAAHSIEANPRVAASLKRSLGAAEL